MNMHSHTFSYKWLAVMLMICLLALSACVSTSQSTAVDDTSSIVKVEEIVIALLLLAAVVAMVTQRMRIPYTVGLVVVGFSLTFFGPIPFLMITPEIILALLVPPLVFEAAFHLNFTDLRRDLPVILTLAVPGVLITTGLVGVMLSYSTGLALPVALLFGSLIAATDPVAVVALFRSLGAPRRLQIIVEGESLLNDGTAIVVFSLMLAYVQTGTFSIGTSVLQFLIVAGGGVLVGGVAGFLVSKLIGRIDNYLVETSLTTVLAYGSYLVAQYVFGVSGVLAVVAAGLASGQIGPRGMSPTTRIVVFNFWEYMAFMANSFIFLIIGLEIDLQMLIDNAPAIGWAILAVLIARAVTVYGLSWIGRRIPFAWKNVLFWGGLRGAISLALALSLVVDVPNRTQLQAMAFGVVLFTLIVESLTMKPLIKLSGLVPINQPQVDYKKQHARGIALRAAQGRLKQLNREGLISDYTWKVIKPKLDLQSKEISAAMHTALQSQPVLHQEELAHAWRESLRAQRSSLSALFRDNVINEDVYTELVSEVDFQLDSPETMAEFDQDMNRSDDDGEDLVEG